MSQPTQLDTKKNLTHVMFENVSIHIYGFNADSSDADGKKDGKSR